MVAHELPVEGKRRAARLFRPGTIARVRFRAGMVLSLQRRYGSRPRAAGGRVGRRSAFLVTMLAVAGLTGSQALAAPRDPAALRVALLDAHNAARAEVGAPPLAWDATLEAEAQAYADVLASTGRFQHSPEPRGPVPEGENLFTGTRDAYSYAQMIDFWIDEKRFFRRAPTPDFSTTGRWQDVGHYTQAVWAKSTRLGCALAHNATDDYLVCRYTPPGNVVGEDVLGGD